MNDATPLSGRTAVVTGASSGIGRAIAETLGAAGAYVLLAGRTPEKMEASCRHIEQAGGRARAVVTDVRDPAQVQALVDRAVEDTGRLDIMVNNAGVAYPAPIADGDPEKWREMLETNVLAVLAGCRAAVRAMRACRAEGFIVNISSTAALRRDSGVYGATKHAVSTISATLRRELENDSIRVINVMPGVMATNFARHFDPAFVTGLVKSVGANIEFRPGEHLPDEVFAAMEGPLRQIVGSPQDVANAVLFCVTQPIHVHIADITVRPPRRIEL